jgi:hypothetical protein
MAFERFVAPHALSVLAKGPRVRIMLETPILFLIGLLVLCPVGWWVYRK